jgi:DNA-binding transcriptional LysR family regulator
MAAGQRFLFDYACEFITYVQPRIHRITAEAAQRRDDVAKLRLVHPQYMVALVDRRNLHSSPPAKDEQLLSGSYWGELRLFLEVARAKSFSNAAKQLKLSHPTIARRVRRLQQQMGVQLLIPTERGIKLTPRGQELAQALARMDESVYAITTGVQEDTRDAEATVSISITNGLNAVFLVPEMQQFSQRNPNIHLHTKSIVSLNDLRENQTDMMLAFVRPDTRSDLVVEQLGSIHYRPLVSKTYVSRHGLPGKDNLENHRFLQSHLYESNHDVWSDWNELVAKGRVSHYCDDPFVYGIMIKVGLGIGLLGTYASVERDAVPLNLGVLTSVPVYGIALRERLRSRPVRIVFDWFCEIFSERNEWFRREFKPEDMPSSFEALNRISDFYAT